jgi:hypothetical protein
MNVIIAGSRTVKQYRHVCEAVIASGFPITRVTSGCARGVDTLGERWARERQVAISRKPAGWHTADGGYDPSAGFRRNQEMADTADALIAIMFKDEPTKGTLDMIKRAEKRKMPVYIHWIES